MGYTLQITPKQAFRVYLETFLMNYNVAEQAVINKPNYTERGIEMFRPEHKGWFRHALSDVEQAAARVNIGPRELVTLMRELEAERKKKIIMPPSKILEVKLRQPT